MIYFDNAATTEISEDVRKEMCKFLAGNFGNPSSIYRIGREAKEAVENAREKAAELLGAKSREIIFTSGATEASNLVIQGVSEAAAYAIGGRPHLITSPIEHHCVLDVFKHLEKAYGAELTILSVDEAGIVDPKKIEKAIRPNTVLVSVMYGNNEVGTVEPIAEIGKIIQNFKEQRKAEGNSAPLYFHTDAVQAFQYLSCDVDELGVDFLTLTAHKFNGPKGVGLLYARSGAKFIPQQLGGAQERGRRAGTENVPYIVGLVKAMELADKYRVENSKKVADLTDYLIKKITGEIPEVTLLGSTEKKERLPHIASFIFRRVEGESILINLDMKDIAASSGSACTSGSLEPSHVTKAMGYTDLDAHGAVRFSLSSKNTKQEVDELLGHLPKIVDKLRAMSPIE